MLLSNHLRLSLGTILLLAVLTLGSSGCGFRPLHGETVSGALSSVEIAPIPGRTGEAIRDALVEILHPGESTQRPVYRLEVFPRSSSEALVTDRTTVVRLYEVRVSARYRLLEIATGREVGSAENDARASHGVIPNEIYSTLVAAETALRRSATLLAEFIATDVVLALNADHRR